MTNSAEPDQIWIYTVCKGRAYLGSAGSGLFPFRKYSFIEEGKINFDKVVFLESVSIVQNYF